MSAYVLLNLSNNLEKAIKCEACRAFYRFFATSLINSILQEYECEIQFSYEVETNSAVQKSVYRYRYMYQHTKDVCPFLAYCVTEFETVYRCLIFWRYLFFPPIVPNKNTHLYKCFTVLIDFFALTVKAATLIFISGRGSAISSAKQGK